MPVLAHSHKNLSSYYAAILISQVTVFRPADRGQIFKTS